MMLNNNAQKGKICEQVRKGRGRVELEVERAQVE